MNCLSRCVFNIWTRRYIKLTFFILTVFNNCRNVKLIVTTKGKLSCIDNLGIIFITKWLSEAIFKVGCNHTVFNLDIEHCCNIFTSFTIVCFDIWLLNIKFLLIVVISDTNGLNIILVVCVKFSCIKPYLVNQFIATFHSLSIQVFFLVVVCLVYVWVRISIRILVCQLFIIINEFITSNVKFLLVYNIFLWLELRFFWWNHLVVELFVVSICSISTCWSMINDSLKNFTILSYLYCHRCFHSIVRNTRFIVIDFFYSISKCLTKISLAEQELFKLDVAIFIIWYSLKNFSILIFQ